jgi:hypothetical protein
MLIGETSSAVAAAALVKQLDALTEHRKIVDGKNAPEEKRLQFFHLSRKRPM